MIIKQDYARFVVKDFLMEVFEMATVKPVQPSVAETIDIWKKIVSTVLKKPSEQQIKKMQKESEMFSKVCADD